MDRILNYEDKRMKKKILLIISVLILVGIGIATVAYTQTSASKETVSCCCKDGSCPMKSHSGDQTAAMKEGKADCPCCKDDNCPMKKDTSTTQGQQACDCDCCAKKSDV